MFLSDHKEKNTNNHCYSRLVFATEIDSLLSLRCVSYNYTDQPQLDEYKIESCATGYMHVNVNMQFFQANVIKELSLLIQKELKILFFNVI